MRRASPVRAALACLVAVAMPLPAQSAAAKKPKPRKEVFNYDEAKVPVFELPDPLRSEDGKPVRTATAWRRRRAEILGLFEDHVYGRTPRERAELQFEAGAETLVFGGKARRRQVRILCRRQGRSVSIDVLLHTPVGVERAPVFLGLNFGGNHSLLDDEDIRITTSWVAKKWGGGTNRATAATRGKSKARWPIEMLIGRGCGVATAYYGDLDPDFDDGFQNGVHPLFEARPASAGRTQLPARPGTAWGSIGAWAFGLSRILDYLVTDARVDPARVIVLGHSRLGKTALWAGAQDERFAMVVSNDSGCGGAALSRRGFGETVARITTSFPHWFCSNFKTFADRLDRLPVDQHMLICLVAPRPVLILSAAGDRWADPRGEFLAGRHADPVYRLLGCDGIASVEWPAVGVLLRSRIGYHRRPGRHDLKRADWEAMLTFAAHHGLVPAKER